MDAPMTSRITVAGAPETQGRVEMTMQLTRLLGFTSFAGLDTLRPALEAVPGPALHIHCSPQGKPGVAALLQDEPNTALLSRGREELTSSLQTMQRRMEVACLAGPFLPMDPAVACCPSDAIPRLLETSWDALFDAVTRHGACHQWEVVLRWTPQHVVAKNRADIAVAAGKGPQILADAVATALLAERDGRETALLAALQPAVPGFAKSGAARGETEISVTVLTPRQGDAAVETALDTMMPEHVEAATIDMRGPLPPLSFSAVRLTNVPEQDITNAWQTLSLPDRIDLAALHRQWRLRAAIVHPDRQAQSGLDDMGTVSGMTAAYRLLRDLLPHGGPGETFTLTSLQRRSGPRLIMPAQAINCIPPLDRDFGHVPVVEAEQTLEFLS